MTRTKLFFDLEFTGLHKKTTIISLGIVSERDEWFYAEFDDYDKSQLDSWLVENVVSNLHLQSGEFSNDPHDTYIRGARNEIKTALINWLSQFESIELWGDCLAYDWVLFCDIFGHAFNIPENIYYIPFDICTLFKIRGIDPDINREEYAGIVDNKGKHNAVWDAVVIKSCYEKLMGR